MKILKKIGQALAHFFVGIFDAMKKAYLNLDPSQQEALKQGAGFINVINSMLDASPTEVRKALQQKFPGIEESALEASIFHLLNVFGLTPVTSLEEAIAAIQKYLKEQEDKAAWSIASHLGATALAFFFAPPGTKFQIITLLIEWVYQHFFKKED